jgi:hypothetical protein
MRIVHVYSSFTPPRLGDRKRISDAQASWWRAYKTAGEWLQEPVFEADMKRNAKTVLGDKKPIPFLLDIIDMGIEQATQHNGITGNDRVFFCNSDVAVAEDIANDIMAHPVTYASRRDFMAVPRRCTRDAISKGSAHPGMDAFSFPVGMWPKIRQEMPDMLIGRSRWDLVARDVLKRNGGVEIYNALGHVMHGQDWITSEEEPSGLWNIDLYWKYESEHGKLWSF